jgi:hypothetical protein
MSGDDWGGDDWYVDQEPHWLIWLRQRGLGRTAVAAVSGGVLVITVCSVLALNLWGRPATGSLPRTGDPVATSPTLTDSAAELAPLPHGMPTHFAFGIMNSPGDTALLNGMRTHNGTAWDFRYQYLAGGVNTGKGWETWNSPTGAFATLYMQESADNGYLPSLIYYELRQSNGPCSNCDDGAADRANLKDPAVMAAYYGNWRLLMQRIGQFGKQVLVIVEPDLWGFLQQSVVFGSNGAASVPASVASSGDTDAAGLDDTAQGFAQALLHMRDRYAPNAILTLHVSLWSTDEDLGSSTDASLDVQGITNSTAQFLLTAGLVGNPKGISTWDVLSNDVSDRDSAQGAAWWDRTNQTFPNFARYLSYISTVSRLTQRRVVLWQVPEGNQYFDTMNDSPHHTQDNRPEYILGHLPDFAHAGIVAVLFGPGQGGTSIDDAANDGITNPHPINSFECDHCNVHLSPYPDDDGGYLRLFVGAYFRGGSLSLVQPALWNSPPTESVNDGPTVTPLAQGTCQRTPVATIGQATIAPNPAHRGQQVTFSVYITLSCNTSAALVVDVYEGGLTKSILKIPDKLEQFVAGQPRLISVSGPLPSMALAGPHTVTVGVFDTAFKVEYGFGAAGVVLQVT